MELTSQTRYDDTFLQSAVSHEKDQDILIYGTFSGAKRSFIEKFEDFFIDRSKISLKEKAYFFHLIAVLIDSGVPLLMALKILSRKFKNVRFQRIIATMAYEMERGKSLSDAMARFPVIFDDGEVAIVKSGELIGNLDSMFMRLSQQVDDDYTLRLKLRTALMYPIMVLIVLCLAIIVVMVFVVPRLAEFFSQNNADLPFFTNILIVSSNIALSYWWIFVLFILFFVFFFHVYRETDNGRFKWDFFKLKIPFVGDVYQKLILSRILRLFSLLLSSGLPLLRVIEILIACAENDPYKRGLKNVLHDIRLGNLFARSLSKMPFIFPEMMTSVLDVGEKSGTLPTAADKLSHYLDREVIHSIAEMTSILEPVLIVIVGLTVLLAALAILSPIFSLGTIIS